MLRLAARRGMSDYPRPTKGMVLAMTVMKSTFASSGKDAM